MARVPRFPINEVYFVSKQACGKRERDRERRRGKHGKNSNQRGVLRLQAFKHVKNSNQRGVLRFDQRGVLRLQACQECDTLPTVESGARSTTFAECCRQPPEVRLTWGSASLDKVSTATACRDEGDGVKVEEAVEAGVERFAVGDEMAKVLRRVLIEHAKSSNQRGVLRLQACQKFQSTRCNSSPSILRVPINKNSNQQGVLHLQVSLCEASEGEASMSRIRITKRAKRAREREGGREGEREGGRERGRRGEHVKKANQRGILQGVLRLQASPSMSRMPTNEVYFVSKHVVSKHVED